MRLTVAALLMLMTAAAVMQVVSGAAFDFIGHSQPADSDAVKMETKIAEALHNIASASPSEIGKSSEVDQKANESSINSSAINRSINATPNNSSMLDSSAKPKGSGGAMITEGSSVSPQGLGASSKGAVNGFWGIQANKHVMGQSDIKSKMFLSGNFDVDKTVGFSDRGV